MPKNYYRILGVNSDATPDELRSAYRQRVKELHPDRHGQDSAPFLALQEAYETLIDPKLRGAYDSKRSHKIRRSLSQKQRRPDPYQRQRPPVEPLKSYQTSPPVEDLTWSRGSIPIGRPPISDDNPLWARLYTLFRPEPRKIFVEIPLSYQQARQGGEINIVIPAEEICSNCGGAGSIGFYRCLICRGMGRISKQLPVQVDFSGRVTNHTLGEISLDRYGLPGVVLVIRFFVV
jgi:DnaJ-class molecular chaperone